LRLPWLRPMVALLVSALFFVPLYFVCANVIKRGDQISKHPAALPIPPTLDNIVAVLTRPDQLFWVSVTNSLIVTVLSVLVLTVLSAMLGHYLARARNRWTRALTLLLLCGLMIPPQVILIPITDVLRFTHLMATLQGLVLFNVGYYVPFGISQSLGQRAGGNSLDNTLRVASRVQTDWILADIRVHAVAHGFGHGLVHLWALDGTLLGTASQSTIVRAWRENPNA